MKMNAILVIIIGISAVIIDCVSGQYQTPPAQVIFFRDRGFEVSIEWEKDISLFAFHGKKNVMLEGVEAGDFNFEVRKPKNGRLIYTNPDVKFNSGDVLYYWIHVDYNGLGYDSPHLSEEVKSFGVSSTGPLPPRSYYEFPEPLVKVLSPRGFEVSIPAEEGMTLMAFHGQINQEFFGVEAGRFSVNIQNIENGRYVFRDLHTKLNPGDKLYYWLHAAFGYVGYNLLDKVYEVTEDGNGLVFSTEKPTTTRPIQVPTETVCITGVSKANGQTGFCKNTEIFNEEFSENSLDRTKWNFERRFSGGPDYEFVLYSDQRARISNNILEIRPSENRALRQFFEIRNCTERPSIPDCVFNPYKVNDIMAPILSSRINTKNAFSFQYGRIEIRAKLPRADWMMPLLLLEPKYESADYINGQIRIALIENNPNVTVIKVKQGPLLGADEPQRTSYMSELLVNSDWASKFHTFAVEWKPEGITTFIDGQPSQVRNWRTDADNIPGSQAWSNSKIAVAPFDQEFFITLGVSVGGIKDFQIGTPWGLKSPTLQREFHQSKFRDNWNYDISALEVDYVKVFAV